MKNPVAEDDCAEGGEADVDESRQKKNNVDQNEKQFDQAYARARDRYNNGHQENALSIWRQLGESGYEAGYYKLAQHAFLIGNRVDLDFHMRRLEALAARGDPGACFSCFMGYRAGWNGRGFSVDGPIGTNFLRRAAELGSPYAQYTLAQELRSGANGQTKDEAGYLYWIEKAIESGSEEAVYAHITYLDTKGQPIPADLLANLDILAADYPNARKLRDKLKRAMR